ncbi:MAG: hypothetical protein EXQ85_00485 [Alphaproteobacteria bacterium]|nr:hypothetical protein [Alphaproteobacteria bacterium]
MAPGPRPAQRHDGTTEKGRSARVYGQTPLFRRMPMKRVGWMIGVVGLAALLGATAQAQPMRGAEREAGMDRSARVIENYDTNKDGKITVDEIVAEIRRLVTAADVDGNGFLSVDEFRRRGYWFQMLAVTSLFDLYDANGDGQLTAEEIATPSRRWFKRYDADGDNAIEAGEIPGRDRRR